MIPNPKGLLLAMLVISVLASFAWGVIGILEEDSRRSIVIRLAPVFLCLLYLLAMSFTTK